MGYHVTILRTKGSLLLPITLDEFKTAATQMPELSPVQPSYNDYCADIIHSGEDNVGLFWRRDGTIFGKNPDEYDLRVMLKLAGLLNARVRGDEMETYRSIDASYRHEDDLEEIRQQEENAKRNRHSTEWYVWLAMPAICLGVIVNWLARGKGRKPALLVLSFGLAVALVRAAYLTWYWIERGELQGNWLENSMEMILNAMTVGGYGFYLLNWISRRKEYAARKKRP